MEKGLPFTKTSLWQISVLQDLSLFHIHSKYVTYSTYILEKQGFKKQEQCGFMILFKNVFLPYFSLPLTGIQQNKLLLMNFQLQNNPRAGKNVHQVLTSTGLPLAIAQRRFLFYISLVTVYNNHFCQEIVNQFLFKLCDFHFQGPHGLPGPKVIQKHPLIIGFLFPCESWRSMTEACLVLSYLSVM